MIDRLKEPLPFPDPVVEDKLIDNEINRLKERRGAYTEIASLALMPQWPKVKYALEQVINQMTDNLVNAQGDQVIRCQESVKAYKFLASLPDRAGENIEEIDRAIQSLGGQRDAGESY